VLELLAKNPDLVTQLRGDVEFAKKLALSVPLRGGPKRQPYLPEAVKQALCGIQRKHRKPRVGKFHSATISADEFTRLGVQDISLSAEKVLSGLADNPHLRELLPHYAVLFPKQSASVKAILSTWDPL
jgi:hypothetical protein